MKRVSPSIPLIECFNLTLRTQEGRTLLRALNFSLSYERAALVGRNGIGKSTLLEVLAGQRAPGGGRIERRGSMMLVPQSPLNEGRLNAWVFALSRLRLEAEFSNESKQAGLRRLDPQTALCTLSPGELRKAFLIVAKLRQPELLLLDEPSQDLDQTGVAWLSAWLTRWPRGLVVATHDRALLSGFQNFMVISEAGCHGFRGDITTLEAQRSAAIKKYDRRFNLEKVSIVASKRLLFEDFSIRLFRSDRVGVIGPNGTGKSALLSVVLGALQPVEGTIDRVGEIGGWMLGKNILSVFTRLSEAPARCQLGALSSGERVRAALSRLWSQTPPLELLVLDAPTCGLDVAGTDALREALCIWPGALLIASHDQAFLETLGLNRILQFHLGGRISNTHTIISR